MNFSSWMVVTMVVLSVLSLIEPHPEVQTCHKTGYKKTIQHLMHIVLQGDTMSSYCTAYAKSVLNVIYRFFEKFDMFLPSMK